LVKTNSNCGLEELRQAVLRRDPLGVGFNDRWGLDLLSRLLRFAPTERISLQDALLHAYFAGPYVSADGQEHATKAEAAAHDGAHDHHPVTVDIDVHDDADADYAQRAVLRIDDLASRFDPETSLPTVLDADATEADADADTDADVDADVASLSATVADDLVDQLDFTCPVCGRRFHGDYAGCNNHLALRKHGVRCVYSLHAPKSRTVDGADPDDADAPPTPPPLPLPLPPCLSEHSMLPLDTSSGWCELQGRRRYIEDMHSIVLTDHWKLFGVFDGHFGAAAARFASKRLHSVFEMLIESSGTRGNDSGDAADNDDELSPSSQATRLERINPGEAVARSAATAVAPLDDVVIRASAAGDPNVTALQAARAMRQAFLQTHTDFERVSSRVPSTHAGSGTTATVAVLFHSHLLVASVGDSRAIICCAATDGAHLHPVVLTADHTPYDAVESAAVVARGGTVVNDGVLLRVNGRLAVTRSFGDAALRDVLSAHPDIIVLQVRGRHRFDGGTTVATAAGSHCDAYYGASGTGGGLVPLFLIVASDGLWDVVSNGEAVELVCEHLMSYRTPHAGLPHEAWHEAAKMLAFEAYLRGSRDNIGVLTLSLVDD
jgi:protein phosphatase 1L